MKLDGIHGGYIDLSPHTSALHLGPEFSFLEGGILGSLRPKVTKSSTGSSNPGGGGGGVFLAASDLKFQSLPWEAPILGGEYSWLAKNRVFWGFWAQILNTQARSCITDSLSHTMCVETK